MTDELADHIARLPPLGEDDPAYVVFGDWLQAKGDPWGELIALQHAGQPTAADTLLGERGATILGGLHGVPEHELVWHLGFLRKVTLRTDSDKPSVLAALRALARLPCARKLEALALAPAPTTFATTRDWRESRSNIEDPWPDWDDLGPLLLRELPTPHLAFGAWPAEPAHAYVRMPSLDMIGRWFHEAHLRSLRLTGSWIDRTEALHLDGLRELAIHFAYADESALNAVTASNLSSLERLTVSLGGVAHVVLDSVYSHEDEGGYPDTYSAEDLANLEAYDVETSRISNDAFRRFLDALPRSLTELGLTSSALTPAQIGILAAHPHVSRLRRLDLSGCALPDDASRPIFEGIGMLHQIGEIDLSRNAFTDPVRTNLTRALPNAVVGERKGDPDFYMRFVATME